MRDKGSNALWPLLPNVFSCPSAVRCITRPPTVGLPVHGSGATPTVQVSHCRSVVSQVADTVEMISVACPDLGCAVPIQFAGRASWRNVKAQCHVVIVVLRHNSPELCICQ